MIGETGKGSLGETGAYWRFSPNWLPNEFWNLSLPPACPLSLMPCLDRVQLLMQGVSGSPRQGRGPGLRAQRQA